MRRISLTGWIIIATLVGLVLGWLDHDVWLETDLATMLNPLSTIFLRMIKSIVVPLLFATLVVGIAGHGDDLKKVGRLALKSIIYFEVVTTMALVVGLVAVHLTKPGVGVSLPPTAAGTEQFTQNHVSLAGVLEHTVPQASSRRRRRTRCCRSCSSSILFGIALAQVKGRPKETMLALLRVAERGDVQVHRHRDEVRADRHRRRHGGDGGEERARGAEEPRQPRRHAVRRADRVRAVRAAAGGAHRQGAGAAVLAARARSRGSSRSRPPRARRRSRWRCRTWRSSACRDASSPSCCPRATRSTSTAPRSTSRWRRSSWRRRRAWTCRSARSCVMMLTLMLTSRRASRRCRGRRS